MTPEFNLLAQSGEQISPPAWAIFGALLFSIVTMVALTVLSLTTV